LIKHSTESDSESNGDFNIPAGAIVGRRRIESEDSSLEVSVAFRVVPCGRLNIEENSSDGSSDCESISMRTSQIILFLTYLFLQGFAMTALPSLSLFPLGRLRKIRISPVTFQRRLSLIC
jgi:hypothetical protein